MFTSPLRKNTDGATTAGRRFEGAHAFSNSEYIDDYPLMRYNDCIIASLPLYAARVTLHYCHVFPRKSKTETLESMINLFEARR
jgi:hypothetical protein